MSARSASDAPWWARGVKEPDVDDAEAEVLIMLAWAGYARVPREHGEPVKITLYYPRGARKTPLGEPDIGTTEITDFISFFACVHKGYIQYDEDVGVFYASHAIRRWVYALHRQLGQ